MATTIGSRFGILPKLQKEREEEISLQAHQVEITTKHQQEVVQQAERIVRDEIDRTRQLKQELFKKDPEWLRWETERAKLEHDSRNWDQSVRAKKENIEREYNKLCSEIKHQEDQLKSNQHWNRELLDRQGILNEKNNLEQQLRQTEVNEYEASQRLEQLQRQNQEVQGVLSDKENKRREYITQVDRIRNELDSIHKEHAAHEKYVWDNEQRLKELEREYDQLLINKKNKEDLMVRERDSLDQLNNRIRERQGVLDSISENKQPKEEKIARAHHVVNRTKDIKEKAVILLKERQRELEHYQSESSALEDQKNELQREIDELYKRLNMIDEKLNKCHEDCGALEDEINLLRVDQEKADSMRSEAENYIRLSNEGAREYEEALRRESKIIDDLMSDKLKVDNKMRSAESNLNNTNERLERTEQGMRDIQKIMSDNIQRCSGHELDERGLQEALENCSQQIQNLDVQIELMKQEQDKYTGEILPLQSMKEDSFTAKQRLLAGINNLNDNLQQISEYEVGIKRYQDEITNKRNNLFELDNDLRNLPQANPFSLQLQKHMADLPEIEQRIISNHISSPPAELLQQIARESEAIMRAELASGILSRQKQIEQEARDLASVKINNDPRIVLDEEAKKELLSKHFKSSADYSDVTKTVVRLTESQHICSA